MTRHRVRLPLGDGTETWHGSASGYNYRGCGCARCREWMRRTKREQTLPPVERGMLRASNRMARETLDSGIDPL